MDRKRRNFGFSLERFSTCHKRWEKGFMGLIANTAAFICCNSVDTKRNTHDKRMKEIHEGYMNNTWDETGSWGIPDVVPQRFLKRVSLQTLFKVRLDKVNIHSPLQSTHH